MRTSDIAYVKQTVVNAYPAKPLEELTLSEIKKKHLSICAKANGDVSVCSKCQTPCAYGKRATQLVANEVYNDPPVPLYGGMTLIERARQENMKRRQEKEMKTSKDNRKFIKDWYDKAIESGDAIKWIMENYGCTKDRAKAKIYQWESRHKEKLAQKTNQSVCSVENKIDALMKIQEDHKHVMLELQKQYEDAKQKYEEISKKIDVLCRAIDIINE